MGLPEHDCQSDRSQPSNFACRVLDVPDVCLYRFCIFIMYTVYMITIVQVYVYIMVRLTL